MTAGGKPASVNSANASAPPANGSVRASPRSVSYDVEPWLRRTSASTVNATRLATAYTARYWIGALRPSDVFTATTAARRNPACAIEDQASIPTPSRWRKAPRFPIVIVNVAATASSSIQLEEAEGSAATTRMMSAPIDAALETTDR